MPIEIRELNIRINVADAAASTPKTGDSASDVKKAIANTCAEMIAESKRKTKER